VLGSAADLQDARQLSGHARPLHLSRELLSHRLCDPVASGRFFCALMGEKCVRFFVMANHGL
jgi:hypothetical protein